MADVAFIPQHQPEALTQLMLPQPQQYIGSH